MVMEVPCKDVKTILTLSLFFVSGDVELVIAASVNLSSISSPMIFNEFWF